MIRKACFAVNLVSPEAAFSRFHCSNWKATRNMLLKITNEDALLKGLEFEAGARDMTEDGRDVAPFSSIVEGIQFVLDVLYLTPKQSENLVKIIANMAIKSGNLPDLFNQKAIYNILFKLYKQHASSDRPKTGTAISDPFHDADKRDPDKLQAINLLERFGSLMSPEARLIHNYPLKGYPPYPQPKDAPGGIQLCRLVGVNSVIEKVKFNEMPHQPQEEFITSLLLIPHNYPKTSPFYFLSAIMLGRLIAIPFKDLNKAISVNFTVHFPTAVEEGLYNLYLHSCGFRDGRPGRQNPMNMTLKMVEKNPSSYLSVGDQPLPTLYFGICLIYTAASFVWIVYLRMSKNLVFKIHYLMFAVVLTKAISLAFHGVNYYVIGNRGVHEEGWAVMYYITHVIRGALLFITILLIGAGWAFIKHMLTPRERNVFIIVIPLQILANLATIVIEESEAGSARYSRWKDIFILMDLACCGAILFPVVWSIRHLQVASQTDGKAAINLRNLRLFRHFYILVICYVYFTRVIASLLSITVNYSLTWVVELFKESITFFFFVAVGFKFRPVTDNPYLLVSDDNDDDAEEILMDRTETDDVWSQSGLTDGVFRLTRTQPNRKREFTNAAAHPGSAKGNKRESLDLLLEPDSV